MGVLPREIELSNVISLIENPDDNCSDLSEIVKILFVLSSSPTADFILRSCAKKNVRVSQDVEFAADIAHYDRYENCIYTGFQHPSSLKTDHGMGQNLIALARGLRKAWHFHSGNARYTGLRAPDFLKLHRFKTADIEAFTVLICRELRLFDYPQAWKQYLSGYNGDIAIVFLNEIKKDPKTFKNGQALAAAYNQWFMDSVRSNNCDHKALNLIDNILLDNENDLKLGKEKITKREIEKIGRVPSGKNYLKNFTFFKPWYEGLDDEYNRIHLEHIINDLEKA